MASTLTSLLSYLLGCFSSAYYLVRWRTGEDVRLHGSGNAGATNAGRVLGKWAFVVALLGDAGKGALAVGLAGWLTGGDVWAVGLAMPAVIVGHIWPAQMKFRGGEGFATAIGALAALDIVLLAVVGGVALVVYLVSRKRSLAGVVALLLALPLTVYLGWPLGHQAGLLVVVLVMLWAFRRHIRSLFERRKVG
ncbi:MAG: glycerol-3-phosphate acyltransferase [Caldilineaceae bacterium]|nr:glycerol-3-phosphate acyltransferase [Caldilineaceae bacterium]HRJ40961.1 glycerol-3-phosphate acyltransferase [Caldilineaceae bacterium]